MKKSFVQVYTGDGKGKTTAAAGLALRAAGRGLCVKFVQFLKGRESGEITAFADIKNVEVLRVAACAKFFDELSDAEKKGLREDVLKSLNVISGWLCRADLLVLDEALGAFHCGILQKQELFDIIDNRGGTEIVLTGRNAPAEVTERAGLVTEMRQLKHYFDEGTAAREGIEY